MSRIVTALLDRLKLTNAAGTLINPATEDTLSTLAADVANGVAVTGPLTDAQLRAEPVPVGGTVTVANPGLTDAQLRSSSVEVADVFTGGEILADQPGTNGVLDFTFATPVQLVWVRLDGGTVNGRVDPFGTVPASGLGIIAEPGIPVPITRTLTALKVWAPAGSTVSVHGYRY